MTRWTKADLEAIGVDTSGASAKLLMVKKPSKMRNRKVTVDGILFDSIGESRRYESLKLMQAAGEIRLLETHKRIPLVVIGMKVCDFVPDFVYQRPLHSGGWVEVVEDFKGRKAGDRWAMFRIKSKLYEALHGRGVEVWPPEARKPRRRK